MNGDVQELVWERFVRGWHPCQLPKDAAVGVATAHLYPRLLEAGQLVDARGLETSGEGVIRWRRDQYMIPGPETGGADLIAVAEYQSQLLALAADGGLYRLPTDWPSAVPTQWDYGYALFAGESWAQVATGLPTAGPFGIALARSRLFLAHRDAPVKRWDGTNLVDVGLAPPTAAPTQSADPEDFSDPTWVETDPQEALEVVGTRVNLNGLLPTPASYLRRDFEEGHFGDFTHRFTFRLDAIGLAGHAAIWSVLNADDSDYLYVAVGDEVGGPNVALYAPGGAKALPISLATPYYGELIRAGTAATLNVYSDAAHTVLVGSVTCTCSANPLSSAYIGSTAGSAMNVWGYVESVITGDGTTLPSGALPKGTYSYQVAFANDDFESMPGPILDVVAADNKRTPLAQIPLGPSGVTRRRLYRAWSPETTPGARGADFQFLVDINDNETTAYTDNAPQGNLGDNLAFDHALPPRGDLLTWHKDRLWLANCSCTSRSYSDYQTTGISNLLFYSQLNDPYYWPGQHYLAVGDETPILALVSWGEHLLIFKQASLWVLTGYDENSWVLEQVSDQVGVSSPGAAAAGPPGVLWEDQTGLWLYDGGLRRVLSYALGPYAPRAAGTAPMVAYHRGEFYLATGAAGLVAWDPIRDSWRRTGKQIAGNVGLLAVDRGRYQCHLLTEDEWVDGGDLHLTLYETGNAFGHADDEGTVSDPAYGRFAVTFPPLLAPAGLEIVPLAVNLEGAWGGAPEVFLSAVADYAENAWEATPTLALGEYLLGVPSGSAARTNAAPIWHLQIRGDWGPGLEIGSARLQFYLRRRGESDG